MASWKTTQLPNARFSRRAASTSMLACSQRAVQTRTRATLTPSLQQIQPESLPGPTAQAARPCSVKLVVEPQLLAQELSRPGLTVVEVQSASYKQEGDEPDAELHWRRDVKARDVAHRTASLKFEASVQRAADDCPDARFLQVKVPDAGPGRKALISHLSLCALPAIQFYNNGELLWEQQGQPGLEKALGAGLLYFTGRGAGGQKLDNEDVMQHLDSVCKVNAWLGRRKPNKVQVLFAAESSGACIRVNPAFIALARNFTSGPHPVEFARLDLDALGPSQESRDLIKQLNLVTAPTFMFFVDGKEQRRYVGSTAADLMGHILEVVQTLPSVEETQAQAAVTLPNSAALIVQQPEQPGSVDTLATSSDKFEAVSAATVQPVDAPSPGVHVSGTEDHAATNVVAAASAAVDAGVPVGTSEALAAEVIIITTTATAAAATTDASTPEAITATVVSVDGSTKDGANAPIATATNEASVAETTTSAAAVADQSVDTSKQDSVPAPIVVAAQDGPKAWFQNPLLQLQRLVLRLFNKK